MASGLAGQEGNHYEEAEFCACMKDAARETGAALLHGV